MDVRVWLWIPARKGTAAQCCWVLLVFFPLAPVWQGWTSCCDSANISVVDCLHCLQSLKVFSCPIFREIKVWHIYIRFSKGHSVSS